jgi:hypothetical protein
VLPAKIERVWSRCLAGRPRGWPGGHFSARTDPKPRPQPYTCPRRSVSAKFRWNPRDTWPAGPLGGRAAKLPRTDSIVVRSGLHVSFQSRFAQVLVRSEEKVAGRTLTWPAGPCCGATDLRSVPLWPAGPYLGRAAMFGHRPSQVGLFRPPHIVHEPVVRSGGLFGEVTGRPAMGWAGRPTSVPDLALTSRVGWTRALGRSLDMCRVVWVTDQPMIWPVRHPRSPTLNVCYSSDRGVSYFPKYRGRLPNLHPKSLHSNIQQNLWNFVKLSNLPPHSHVE